MMNLEPRYERNDRAAQQHLLRAFKSWQREPHDYFKSLICYSERRLMHIFEGAGRIEPARALSGGLVWHPHAYQPTTVARELDWACRQGLVVHSEANGRHAWTLVRPGVTFVPRPGNDADSRTLLRVPGGLSVAGLMSREAKFRARETIRLKSEQIELLVRRLARLRPETNLGEDLSAPDLPPVTTIGELRDNAHGFLTDMPYFRLLEIAKLLLGYPAIATGVAGPYAARSEAGRQHPVDYGDLELPPSDIAPPELKDLEL